MLSDRQFCRWISFLREQVLALEAMRVGHTEGPHGSPEVVAFLKMNDAIVKEKVEQAVSEFAERNVWPDWLNADQIVNLTHRATLAHGLLTMMQNGQLMHTHALPMPKAKE